MTRAASFVFITMISCAHAREEKPSCLADKLGALELGPKSRPSCRTDSEECIDACEDGDGWSCWARATRLESDEQTKAEARLLYRRACRLGIASGCTNYAAHLWIDAESPAEVHCAIDIFAKACDARDAWGCGMHGRLLVDRSVDEKGREQGRVILEKSCEAMKAFPCRVLALELEKDRLGPYDPARIQALLALACEGGDEDACGDHASAAETFH